MKKINPAFIARASVIAALYAALTLALAPISYGLVQFRISEALTVLAYFTPAAIPGLFLGCLISNIIGPYGILDIIFGSMATLLAAILTYKIRNKFLAPLPPVLTNAFIVGPLVAYFVNVPFYMGMLYVGIGQLAVCYGLGLPLIYALRPFEKRLF
ncbi:MAG TPA: QueT transporter family protein [Clostridia bacterium]|nr:QueT transporter family protein [Clostridia bacterium]HPQ46988.1 QueT transporter family protein [Clostridia bacterium]